jgi:hypothetical protein
LIDVTLSGVFLCMVATRDYSLAIRDS